MMIQVLIQYILGYIPCLGFISAFVFFGLTITIVIFEQASIQTVAVSKEK